MRKGMDSGADDYITKPFTSNELLSAVRSRFARMEIIVKQNKRKIEELRRNIVDIIPDKILTLLNNILELSDILAFDYQSIERERVGEIAHDIQMLVIRLNQLARRFQLFAQTQFNQSWH